MNCSTKTHKTTKKETLLGQARRNKCEQNKSPKTSSIGIMRQKRCYLLQERINGIEYVRKRRRLH